MHYNFHNYLWLDLCVFGMTIEIRVYSQLDLCVSFYSCFFAHEVLFRKLRFTRLFAVRFMRCAWKFHLFQFKCVCSSYYFYADLTIYEFCNTKKIITVTAIVEGLTNKVLQQWKSDRARAYKKVAWTCQSHRRMTIREIGWEVWFGQQFIRW